MIPLLAASAGLSLADGVYKYFTGANQEAEANRLARTPRPVMQIPQGMNNAEGIYTNLANQSLLPGQGLAENTIDANGANAINAVKENGNPNDTLAAIMGINANSNNAKNDLSIKAAQMKQQNMGTLANFDMSKAAEQDKLFDYNLNQPYQKAMASASALRNAAGVNKYSGLRTALDTGEYMLTGAFLKKLFGGTDKQTPLSQYSFSAPQVMGPVSRRPTDEDNPSKYDSIWEAIQGN